MHTGMFAEIFKNVYLGIFFPLNNLNFIKQNNFLIQKFLKFPSEEFLEYSHTTDCKYTVYYAIWNKRIRRLPI